jgi:hypothetical protein
MDLYLIPTRSGRYTLFSPPEVVYALEQQSADRVRQFIEWFVRRRNRVIAWIGRGVRSAHDYYRKLEDKIDPVERILKAMDSADGFLVYATVPNAFQITLRRQRWKHIFWFSIDFVLTGVVLVFTPFLAPIPGPNVFFYYPLLRLLSHYRAIRGATSGLRSSAVEYKGLPELSRLEDNLSGLTRFLERMD